MSDSAIEIWAFYRFQTCDPKAVRDYLLAHCEGVHGLMILAEEGVNATISGVAKDLEQFWSELGTMFDLSSVLVKRSYSDKPPFRRFVAKIKPEIVTTGDPSLRPQGVMMLSPEEWHQTINSGEDIVVLDTRNTFETSIGMFRGAIDPRIKSFAQLPARLEQLGIPKDKKVLMYCTGGIRCEKASEMMFRQGYKEVYQLHGGILDYMKEFPQGDFEGECFVFDQRVAVNSQLEPSTRYAICPNCGSPAETVKRCRRCSRETKICGECIERGAIWCCLDCAYHGKRAEQRE